MSYQEISEKDFKKLKMNIQYIDGVLYLDQSCFWSLSVGYLVAYVKVNIQEEYDSGKISAQIKKLLQNEFRDIYVECSKDWKDLQNYLYF